jgi:predicted outer membrane repeat protein
LPSIVTLTSLAPLDFSTTLHTTVNFKEGDALTLYQTMLSLQGEITFEYNHAKIGGAIVATESEIYLSMNNQVYVVNNTASISGGGLYLAQSELFSLQDSN